MVYEKYTKQSRLMEINYFRWFSCVYLVVMFFLFPLFVFGVSLGGAVAMYIVFIPLLILALLIIALNLLQKYKPEWLPGI